jgi:hypothetical protein
MVTLSGVAAQSPLGLLVEAILPVHEFAVPAVSAPVD